VAETIYGEKEAGSREKPPASPQINADEQRQHQLNVMSPDLVRQQAFAARHKQTASDHDERPFVDGRKLTGKVCRRTGRDRRARGAALGFSFWAQ
jgi:hypothetical protein